MMPAATYPEFSWSYSRHRTLCDCPRRYWYAYYAAHGGWSSDAPALARAAYRLKQLRTIEMALGVAVHRRAAEYAAAVRARRPPAARPVMVRRTRDELNALCRASRDRGAFLVSPKHSPMLFEAYYGGGLLQDTIDRVSDRLERCLYHLANAALWGEVGALTPHDVLLLDAPAPFELRGLTVYAAPDLVYRADGAWTVVDYKTGAASSSADAAAQLAVYALYIKHGLGVPDAEDRTGGRLVWLGDGRDAAYPFAREDLDAAEAGVRESVGRMRFYLIDVAANAPQPAEAFPTCPTPSRCGRCNFVELCQPDVARDLAAAASVPAVTPHSAAGCSV